MKTKWKTIMKAMLGGLMLCFLMLLAVPSVESEAASKRPTCSKTRTLYVQTASSWYDGHTVPVWNQYQKGMADKSYNERLGIAINNLVSNAKITSVKSSNPKVLTAKYSPKKYKKGILVTFKNFGTSKVTFKVKQNGKTYTLSCRYTFKKIPTPFKSLKVGGKQIASRFTGRSFYSYDTGKTSVKISYRAKSNVQIAKITYYNTKTGKEIKVKNNSRLNIPSNGISLTISYRYKYGKYTKGAYDYVSMYLSR